MNKEGLTFRDIKIILAIAAISLQQGLQYGVSPVLREISEFYSGVDISLVQMLITAPAILAMGVGLLSGWMVTKVSKKKLLMFAALVSGISGLLPLLTDSFLLLFLSRVIYGISLGLATSLNAAVVADFYDGPRRIFMMGIQAATIGIGMMIATTLAGILGKTDFRNSYYVNLLGLASFVILFLFLPDTGKVRISAQDPIHLSRPVWIITAFAFVEFLFLSSFTTNISMHLAGRLRGNTVISSILIGVFSGVQIVAGVLLGYISQVTKIMTMPVAMFSFAVGAVILIAFPEQEILLIIGSVFCGLSQGVFVPTAFTEANNAVRPNSAAMASAVVTCANCLGQLVSPIVLNKTAGLLHGGGTTSNVFLVSAIGACLASVGCFLWKSDRIFLINRKGREEIL